MDKTANTFLLGAIVLACLIISLFFTRFWRKTRDRLFLFFATSFFLMGFNWAALAFIQADEVRTALYFIRLLAFILILYAIYDKNRSAKSATATPE